MRYQVTIIVNGDNNIYINNYILLHIQSITNAGYPGIIYIVNH